MKNESFDITIGIIRKTVMFHHCIAPTGSQIIEIHTIFSERKQCNSIKCLSHLFCMYYTAKINNGIIIY